MNEGEFRFDKRIIERNLRQEKVTREEYRRYLQSLKDLTQQTAPFESELCKMGRRIPGRVMDDEEDEL